MNIIMNNPTNRDDVLDSRDIIERIETLQGDLNAAQGALWDEKQMEKEEDWDIARAEAGDADPNEEFNYEEFEPLDLSDQANVQALPQSDERDELLVLLQLQDEAEGCSPDWPYGATLIRDSYFQDYAQELAEDCGMLKDSASWPHNCIDWEQAARELQMDYTSVDFDGVTYWVR